MKTSVTIQVQLRKLGIDEMPRLGSNQQFDDGIGDRRQQLGLAQGVFQD